MTWQQGMVNFLTIIFGIIAGAMFNNLGETADLTMGQRYFYFAGFIISMVIVLYALYKASNEMFGDDDDLTPA
ncbi:hypothetical protein PP939_gp174 [Rhizobium phage RL38J1]|uniref:Transmembrane protein n=1 Tax=Rhizobium phage RL38J1 TaxID=2663232 RepID=A0A6B9J384_9CAUD|nr:hypothetical protein PP939_gp174 [Rhizobium phage RL38J1]QGZ14052.1 hypothetical protein RL38J1_174 [Rhizobium phage RL38J1]